MGTPVTLTTDLGLPISLGNNGAANVVATSGNAANAFGYSA